MRTDFQDWVESSRKYYVYISINFNLVPPITGLTGYYTTLDDITVTGLWTEITVTHLMSDDLPELHVFIIFLFLFKRLQNTTLRN